MTTSEFLIQFFKYDHLQPHLQEVSRHFHAIAHNIIMPLPENDQKSEAMRRLLEAKDCAVRAVLVDA